MFARGETEGERKGGGAGGAEASLVFKVMEERRAAL